MISMLVTTFGNKRDARRVSDILLKKRLAACVKLADVSSSYLWKGKIERHGEVLAIVTTKRSKAKSTMAEIRKNHPYEVPEILEIGVGNTDPKYSKWVNSI